MPTPSLLMWNRLLTESRDNDLADLLQAQLRDPAWLLCRQWQFGEFKGEDAALPIYAQIAYQQQYPSNLLAPDGRTEQIDPQVPIDYLLERNTFQLDASIRLEIGLHWLRMLNRYYNYNSKTEIIAAFRESSVLHFRLPASDSLADQYANAEVLSRQQAMQVTHLAADREAIDGARLLNFILDPTTALSEHVLGRPNQSVDQLGEQLQHWSERVYGLRLSSNPYWNPSRLEHRFTLQAPQLGVDLPAEAYQGDGIDWHQFNQQTLTAAERDGDPVDIVQSTVIPTTVSYIGMPRTRWWEMEDQQVNYGNISTTTTNPIRLLFAQFNLIYGNDWWLLPITAPIGSLLRVQEVLVQDNFGFSTRISPTLTGQNHHWDYFNLHDDAAVGSTENWFYYPQTFRDIQQGEPIETVFFIRDEMANMVWAMEETISDHLSKGVDAYSQASVLENYLDQIAAVAAPVPEALKTADFAYELTSEVPENWIPFVLVKKEGELPRLRRAAMPRIRDGFEPRRIRPQTTLLREGYSEEGISPYDIVESEVPRAGLQLTGLWRRTRGLDGQIFVWYARRKQTGRGEGRSNLRFDRQTKSPH